VIPRYQKILFTLLLLATLGMGGILWRLRERAHQRLVAGEDSAPTQAPQVAPAESATLLVASDTDGGLRIQMQSLPLPADPGARARAILGRLLDLYAGPGATHSVPGGASSVAQVFLVPIPNADPASDTSSSSNPSSESDSTPPQLAVVNLTASFAANHPSGIETETLTVLSICGTLHANLPHVIQVRFLVDGQQKATLAGHADLTRTYLAAEGAPSQGTGQ